MSADTGRAGVDWLRAALVDLPTADADAAAAVAARAADILRPAGALARLDDLAVWIAGWQRTDRPRVQRPVGLVFAADHGVAAAGVSAYPTEVTAAMLHAYRSGQSTVSVLGAVAGAEVHAVDVGVGRPTGDIRVEPALDRSRADEIVHAARAAVDGLDTDGSPADLLVLGEMGIGNTTPAAALALAVCGGTADDWVGRGTGVDDDGLARKRDAVATAVARLHHDHDADQLTDQLTDAVSVLCEVGGAELLALATAVVAARHRRLPVLLDGYVVTASLAPLALAHPGLLDHCRAGHCSAEPGHRRLLDRLGLRPLLDLDMRLGEGSGAMAAVPLVRMACAGVSDVPTFTEWFGPGGGGAPA